MASYECDQAEGLRRMLAGPKPRIFTFLSAASDAEKSTMLVNLGASLAAAGSSVVVLDACTSKAGIAHRMELSMPATLLDVARQERALSQVVCAMPQGFGLASLTHGSLRATSGDADQMRRLAYAFGALATQSDVLLVDAELDQNDCFSLPALADGEIVVQVTPGDASIKQAYGLIKRLNAQLGRRPFGILVTGADEREAATIYKNMAQAANRYLALQLHSVGSIPPDEYTTRAAHLGRAVTEAFPLAVASVAFRRLAQRFALSANGARLGA